VSSTEFTAIDKAVDDLMPLRYRVARFSEYPIGWDIADKKIRKKMQKGKFASDEAKDVKLLETVSQRAQYRVTFKDQMLVDAKNNPVQNGEYLFAMDKFGKFYIGSMEEIGHHSAFFGGGPVSLAGHIVIENGKVTKISNGSGHYEPPRSALDSGVSVLKEEGAFNDGPKGYVVEDWSGGKPSRRQIIPRE
jgi:hypothetical protein